MPLQFRRRKKIAPGVHLNVGKTGLSLSLGKKGAGVTIGGKGTSYHMGIPGTGLSYRGKVSKKDTARYSSSSYSSEGIKGCLVTLGELLLSALIGLPLLVCLGGIIASTVSLVKGEDTVGENVKVLLLCFAIFCVFLTIGILIVRWHKYGFSNIFKRQKRVHMKEDEDLDIKSFIDRVTQRVIDEDAVQHVSRSIELEKDSRKLENSSTQDSENSL